MKALRFLSILLFFSCSSDGGTGVTQNINVEDVLTFRTSDRVKYVKGSGIDSYVAYLITENQDTLHIELGERGVINDLYDIAPSVFPLSQKQGVIERTGKTPSADEVLFSEYPEEDKAQNIFDENYFLYDTINTIVVKLVQPKRIGKGITGLYIPKLRNGKSFSIYGSNLDSAANKEALLMFKTLRYQ